MLIHRVVGYTTGAAMIFPVAEESPLRLVDRRPPGLRNQIAVGKLLQATV
jgi:hypothetical protein